MTQAQARTVANVILVTAGVAAAYVVWRTPSLRRLAGKAARIWLGTVVPAYVIEETRRAWVESGRTA